MHLLLDPVIYAVPAKGCSDDTFVNYVRQLSNWSQEVRRKRHNFYVWWDCLDALHAADCYPHNGSLQQLWARMEEEVVSLDLVLKATRSLFAPPNLDDVVNNPALDALLVDADAFTVHPDLLDRLDPIVADSFMEALGKVAFLREKITDSPALDLHLGTHPLSDKSENAAVSAYVMSAEQEGHVSTELPLITSPDDLDRFADFMDIWEDAERGIRWMWRDMQLNQSLGEDVSLAPFHIGPGFVESIKKYALHNREGYLRTIYRKSVLLLVGLASQDKDEHHTLDKHKQRMHGRWGAMRLHVTAPPLSVRLHYWRDGNQFILANVVVYENFNIDPPPEDAFVD